MRKARKDGYAVPACSVHTPGMIEGVLRAAEEARSPVILQVGQRAIRYAGLAEMAAWVRLRARKSPVPVVLHLDHSHAFDQVIVAIREGFTSAMLDAAEQPLAENIRRTSEVVRVCHAAGISVEGEVGRIAGVEDDVSVSAEQKALAGVDEALRFIAETDVDALAPAIGSVHGLGDHVPELDWGLLDQLRAVVALPMVLHGGSGLPAATLARVAAGGIAKVNLDTELRRVFLRGMGEAGESVAKDDPYPVLEQGVTKLAAHVRRRMSELGSVGRA